MTDERGGDAALAEELLLERQDDRELIHGASLRTRWAPRPTFAARCSRAPGIPRRAAAAARAEVITGIIDEDHEIVALVLEGLLDPVSAGR